MGDGVGVGEGVGVGDGDGDGVGVGVGEGAGACGGGGIAAARSLLAPHADTIRLIAATDPAVAARELRFAYARQALENFTRDPFDHPPTRESSLRSKSLKERFKLSALCAAVLAISNRSWRVNSGKPVARSPMQLIHLTRNYVRLSKDH